MNREPAQAGRTLRLAVVVPILDEERRLPELLASLDAQSHRPALAVLVDDGSTDRSPAVAADYARTRPWVRVVRRPARRIGRDRLVESSELVAFQEAVAQLDEPWDVVAKIDADLVLPPDTFATMAAAFSADSSLGMAGPFITEVGANGKWARKRCGPGHVEGATKFYRRECWEAISPLPPILGWDTIDEMRARMRGWRTQSFEVPGGDPRHQRPMGAHDGLLRAHRRWGACAYGYGESPLLLTLVALRSATEPPGIAAGVNYVAGWAAAALRRRPRAERELRAYARRAQHERIRRRLMTTLLPAR